MQSGCLPVACEKVLGYVKVTAVMAHPLRVRLWSESQLCMPLRKRFADYHPMNGNEFVENERDL